MSEIQLVQLTLFLPENLSGLEKKSYIQAFRPATLLKRVYSTGVFFRTLQNFYNNTFFIEHLWWLLLKVYWVKHFIFMFVFHAPFLYKNQENFD